MFSFKIPPTHWERVWCTAACLAVAVNSLTAPLLALSLSLFVTPLSKHTDISLSQSLSGPTDPLFLPLSY